MLFRSSRCVRLCSYFLRPIVVAFVLSLPHRHSHSFPPRIPAARRGPDPGDPAAARGCCSTYFLRPAGQVQPPGPCPRSSQWIPCPRSCRPRVITAIAVLPHPAPSRPRRISPASCRPRRMSALAGSPLPAAAPRRIPRQLLFSAAGGWLPS